MFRRSSEGRHNLGKVTILPVVTRLDLPVDRILDQARDANLKSVVILGYGEEETEYFASSMASGPNVLWLMERLKLELLKVVDEEQ